MPNQNNENTLRHAIKIPSVATGAEVVVDLAGAGQLIFDFDVTTADMSRAGSDLVFMLDNGGNVKINNFFEAAEGASLPEFVLADNTVVAGEDLLSAYGIDMTPAAAAAAPGSGLGAYNSDPGNLVGGLDGSGTLDPFFWSGGNNTGEEFVNSRYPGGSFDFSISTDMGGAFSATLYEDAQPFQHLGNAGMHAGKISMDITPDSGSSIGVISFSGLPAGAQLYAGDPASGNFTEVLPDANGVYHFSESNFSGAGVYITPPANNDLDINISVSVNFENSGLVAKVDGSFTVIVDAVADKPDYQLENALGITNDAHHMSKTTTTEDFVDGYNAQESTVSSGAGEGKVSVTLSVTSAFSDFDGSETHYVLVELPSGFTAPASYETYIDEADGKEYLMIPADGKVDHNTGVATVEVTLETTSYDSDTVITLKTGSMAVEDPSDKDFDNKNDRSVVIPGQVNFQLDVVDSALDIKMGWASEGNDNAGHMATSGVYGPNFASMNDVYSNSGNDEGTTGVSGSSTNAYGAPITIGLGSVGSGSANTIDQVVLIVEAGRGVLVDGSGSGIAPDAPGGNTYTFNGAIGAGTVYFQPNPGSFDHSDVSIKYEVSVSNSTTNGDARATYTGAASIVTDAVADYATIANLVQDYGSDAYGTMSAAKPGGTVKLEMDVNFPDSAGGENHYVLIKAGVAGIDSYGNCTIGLADGTVVDTVDLSGLIPNAGGYYEVSVPNIFNSSELNDVKVNVEVKVDDNITIDTDITVSMGSKTEVIETSGDTNKEYDKDNNISINVSGANVSVAPANSDENLATVDTYETNAAGQVLPNKHGVTGSLTVVDSDGTVTGGNVSGYDLNKLGDITFALDGGKNAAGNNNTAYSTEVFTSLKFTVEGKLDDLGSLTVKGGGDVVLSYSYDPQTNTTTVSITDASPSESVITVNFKPGAYSDNDLEIMDYELNYINSKSHHEGKITESGVSGAPVETVIVDAVAAKAIGLGTDRPDYNGSQAQAKPDEEIKVQFKMNVPETADTDENHALTLKVGGNNGYNSVTLTGGTDGDLKITFDTPSSAVGSKSANVHVNGVQSSEFTVEVISINGSNYYKISGAGFENYLTQVNGAAAGEISFDAALSGINSGGGNYTNGSSVGMLIEDFESDSSGTTAKNNISHSEKPYNYEVACVGTKIGMSVGTAYENAGKFGNQGVVDRADLLAAIKHLQEGSAAITINGVIAGESITKAVFVADYPGNTNGEEKAPGQFMYKGVLVNLLAIGGEASVTIDGQAVSCKVDADGKLTITIDNYEPLDAGGNANLYFVPGENYNHNDVSINYGVTITDGDSGQSKVFASDHSNPDLFPGSGVAGTDYDPVPGKEGSAVVDAVAQRPDITDITVDMLQHGGNNTIPHGSTAAINVDIDLHGDFDGTEGHIFYVRTTGNDYPVESIVVEYVGADRNTYSFTVSPADIGLQQTNLGGELGSSVNYSSVDLGEVISKFAGSDDSKLIDEGNITVTVNVGTPGSGAGSTVSVGVSSHENWYEVQQGWENGKSDTEFNLGNNHAWAADSVQINLSSASRPSMSIDKAAFYENNNAVANEGEFNFGTGIPLSLNLGDNNDALTNFEVSLNGTNADLGDLILFSSTADYNAFDEAVNAASDSSSPDYGKSAHDILADFISDGKAQNMGDKIVLGDISGMVTNDGKGEFTGKIVFMPDTDSYSGLDPQVDCSIVVRDTASGQYASNGGYKGDNASDAFNQGSSGGIIADAVAQKPDAPEFFSDSGANINIGETRTLTVSANFGDMDASTEHYILIEAKAGWTLTCNGQTLSPGNLETYSEGGKVYYNIPVTPARDSADPNSPDYNSGSTSVEIGLTAPGNALYYQNGNTYNFEVRAGSTDKDLRGNELTFHNNTAISEAGGGLSGTVGGNGHGGGTWYFNQTSALYEDNNPDSNVAGDDPNGVALGGNFSVGDVNCADGYVIISCDTIGGEPIFEIAGGVWVPGSGWRVDLDSSGNANIEVTLSDAYLADEAHNDADLNFDELTFYDNNNNVQITIDNTGNRLEVVVDAVADRADLQGESIKTVALATGADRLTDAVVGGGDDTSAKFVVNANFPDHADGSETHYVLVEKIPAWEPTVSSGEVHIDGKTYYKIDVTSEVKANGSLNYEVEMKYAGSKADIFVKDSYKTDADGNPVLDSQNRPIPEKGAGAYELNYGTMSQEKVNDNEVDLQNNVAINLEGEVTLKYSPVTSSVNMSVTENFTTEGVGNTITLALGQIDTANTQDTLIDLQISYSPADGSTGALYLVDDQGSQLYTISSGHKFTDTELENLSNNGYKLVFEQSDYNHQDVSFSWSGTIKDLVSGATETKTGGTTVVMDAAAQGSAENYPAGEGISVVDHTTAAAGVISGNNAIVTIKASFPDTENVDNPLTLQVEGSEEHWVVLEQSDLDYSVTKATIYAKDGNIIKSDAEVVTKFGPDGTPYFAVQVPAGAEVSVAFEVTTPGGLASDTEIKLNGGTIAIDNTKNSGTNGEPTHDNNWTANIGQGAVEIQVGVIETRAVTVSAQSGISEGDYSKLGFDGIDAAYNEEAVITINSMSTGAGLYYYDGTDYIKVTANPLSITYHNDGNDNMVPDQEYYVRADDHYSGNINVKYSSTVTDVRTGESTSFAEKTTNINIKGVASGSELDAPTSGYNAAPASGAHAASAQITATFDDTDGSEKHYLLFNVPSGMQVDGAAAVTVDAAWAGKLGIPAGAYYRLEITGNSGSPTNINFSAIAGYDSANDTIKVWGLSEETGSNIAPNSNYAISEGSTINIGDLNTAVIMALPQNSTLTLDADWTACGNMNLADMFSDADGDVLSYSLKYNGVDYALGAAGADIPGDYGTLHVNADGTYTYTPADGQHIDSSNLEDFTAVTVTASDGYGSTISNMVGISLEILGNVAYGSAGGDNINANSSGMTIYGGAGNDTIFAHEDGSVIFGGAGDDVMHGGAGGDVFAWAAGDLETGGMDTIVNFDVSADKMFVEGLMNTGTSAEQQEEITGLLSDGDLLLSLNGNSSITLEYEGQQVELQLKDALSDEQYNSLSSADTAESDAAKAQLLMNILNSSI